MSRTIRRTTTPSRGICRFEKDYIYSRSEHWRGLVRDAYTSRGERAFPLVKPEPKTLKKRWWAFHSDKGCASFAFEKSFNYPMVVPNKTQRARDKQQMVKWLKNQEYVPFFHVKQEWDYC